MSYNLAIDTECAGPGLASNAATIVRARFTSSSDGEKTRIYNSDLIRVDCNSSGKTRPGALRDKSARGHLRP